MTPANQPLTARQRKFVEVFCDCLNATKAARVAGYAHANARIIGRQNLTKLNIAAAIEQRLAESIMTPQEAAYRLSLIGRGTFANFLVVDPLTKSVRIDLNTPDAQENLHVLKKVKQRRTIRHTKEGPVETVYTEIELYDALDAIWKILQLHMRYQPTLNNQKPQTANVVVYKLPDGQEVRF
ncbi:terminase small subunit [Spirosoma luteum]|uniref:terminase small subunit n=1 Tax=Spirosoma luteum TaxID=431553 RepID=UPI000379DAE6|nr:terminase small subunit [Spirosoma luteum]